MSLSDRAVPTLPGWISLTEASTILGLSRQYVYKKAGEGLFRTLHRIGSQPSYVVSEDEVAQYKDYRTMRKVDELGG